jgi:trans-2,3-dihydro-3-hydroxyanthranilate isomerase
LRFYIVDVFAETRYSGNQLAVFRDTWRLSGAEMQQIAQEMHYSETTFIGRRRPDGSFDVRVFTPDFELPFAGHPTLGTAYVVQSQVIRKPVGKVRLNMKVGQVPVSFSYRKGKPGVLWMRQKTPNFGKTFEPSRVARILGVSPGQLDRRFPILQVSTGIPFVIVPMTGLAAVRNVKLDAAELGRFVKESNSIAVLVFSRETYRKGNDLNVRVLGPSPGIPEDPATGSGNGCLAAYLVKERYFGGSSIDLRVEQGYEIGRRSLLLLRARGTAGGIEVNVGGRVQFIARGEFPNET